jgi:Fe-S oxidoreductase
LLEMLQGDVIKDGWASTEVHDALDLCLSCKGCKSDCPVDVDMATYKAEFLHHHYAGRIRPAAHYSMGYLPLLARLASATPGLINRAGKSPLSGLMKRAGGIAPERSLPEFAAEPFTKWFRNRTRPGAIQRPPVLLWPDTFDNYFTPEVARAATEVLEDAGFTVVVPDAPVCCGLTWVSTGQLDVAKKVMKRSLRALAPYMRTGMPIVGLEPSCTAALRSDLVELLPGAESEQIAATTKTLAEVLDEAGWTPPSLDAHAIKQTHCHQHAVLGSAADSRVMERAGIAAETLDSGCCGLAGNFGFERGHYEVSTAVGEQVLLPAVRAAAAETEILADGFSCRTQIAQQTGRRAVHLAQLLRRALD